VVECLALTWSLFWPVPCRVSLQIHPTARAPSARHQWRPTQCSPQCTPPSARHRGTQPSARHSAPHHVLVTEGSPNLARHCESFRDISHLTDYRARRSTWHLALDSPCRPRCSNLRLWRCSACEHLRWLCRLSDGRGSGCCGTGTNGMGLQPLLQAASARHRGYRRVRAAKAQCFGVAPGGCSRPFMCHV
jgi:hypothetical protein